MIQGDHDRGAVVAYGVGGREATASDPVRGAFSSERLSSSELAGRWSVSATPLREAVQRLAANGLVECVSQRGARVSEVSLRDVREVYGLRLMLEPMARERSLRRVDDAWRRQVEEPTPGCTPSSGAARRT